VESFTRLAGIAAPLLRANIDTDQIIPARYLLRTDAEGLADGLFAGWRYRADGTPDPAFILNRAPWTAATILLAERNFGCGSSREFAPKALRQWGIRAVIAPSFGGIFFGNCFRNGILPVELPVEAVRRIAGAVEAAPTDARVGVDLEAEIVTAPDGEAIAFRAPPLLRRMLLDGLDEIALTLARQEEIEAYRARDRARRPWAYHPGQDG
jgi:3-isopropylmalate/(R)-2-methylmalate dehydratase small subunit